MLSGGQKVGAEEVHREFTAPVLVQRQCIAHAGQGAEGIQPAWKQGEHPGQHDWHDHPQDIRRVLGGTLPNLVRDALLLLAQIAQAVQLQIPQPTCIAVQSVTLRVQTSQIED